ncbi:hypothetical protein D9M71_645360 [compost metagenome]
MLAQHFVAVHVVVCGHLHGGADEALRAGEVEPCAHAGLAQGALEVCHKSLVAGVDAQLGDLSLLQLGEKILTGKGFLRIEQGDRHALLGHFIQQAQHGAATAALARDQVAGAAGKGVQLVVDRPALDTCDQHYCFTSRTAGPLGFGIYAMTHSGGWGGGH